MMGGRGISTVQKQTLNQLAGLQSTAAEIDIGVSTYKGTKINLLKYGIKSDYVYPYTGTDNTTIIQGVLDTLGTDTTKHYTVVLPENEDGTFEYFCGNIIVPSNVNFWCEGSAILVAGVSGLGTNYDYTKPHVKTTGFNKNERYNLKHTTSFNLPHRFHDENTVGLHCESLSNSTIFCERISGYTVGLLETALIAGGGYTAYNNFILNNLQGNKIGIKLLGTDSTGWVNENKHFGGNITMTSNLDAYGSTHGIVFDRLTVNSYTGQNQNVFENACFQVGDKNASYNWSAGKTGVKQYQCFYNSTTGREYRVESVGDSQTLGTIAPSQTDYSTWTDSNGVQWKDMGYYRRTPVSHRGAGSNNKIVGSRWETGFGGFAYFNSAYSKAHSDGNLYEAYLDSFTPAFNNVSPIDDMCQDAGLNSARLPRNNVFKIYESDAQVQNSVVLNDLDKRCVGGSNGCFIPNFTHRSMFSETESQFMTAANSILTKYGVYVAYSSLPIITLDTSVFKGYNILENSTLNGRTRYSFALDSTGTYIDLDPNIINPMLLGGNATDQVGGYKNFREDNPVTSPLQVKVVDAVKSIKIGYPSRHLKSLEINIPSDMRYKNNKAITLAKDTRRICSGTPVFGYFTEGEIIPIYNGNGNGYKFLTSGILAPTWSSGTTVIDREFRVYGTHVYYANSAGTTGVTPPTHTTGSVSDGTITWTYECEVATYIATASIEVTSNTTGITGATKINNIVSITQSAYDALGVYDNNTVYVING